MNLTSSIHTGQNIYLVECDVNGNVVFADTVDIDDSDVENTIGGEEEACGAQQTNGYVVRKMCENEFNVKKQS